SAVSRAFPFPESRNTLSGAHQRPLPPEPISSQPLRPSQEQRAARAITAIGESQEEEKGVADMTWGASELPAPLHPIPDQAQTSQPPMMMPAVPATQPRRNIAARLALVVLFMIAAGLAVYQFVLRPKKPAPPPPPVVAALKFVIQPADAIVEVGGREVGHSSPIEKALDPGVYTVTVRRQGYKKWSKEVTLRDAEKQTVNVALEPGVAHVSVTSQPAGLVTTLDGKQLEQVTPIELDTPAGPHQLMVTNASGLIWTQDFTAETDAKYTFNAPLTQTKKNAPTAVGTGAVRQQPERVSERQTERQTERAIDRTPDRGNDRPAKRPGGAISRGKEPEPEVAPPLPKTEEPPPPPKLDAGVPTVAQPAPKLDAGVPAGPKAPPMVAVNTVSKLSGDIPQLKVNVTDASSDVTSKVCIGVDGHVTSVKILRALPDIVDELQRALMSWRYKPYVNSAGQVSPACFALAFRVVFKHSN
ncbi:MAG TPA: PEGA domain-containing protein, partial [Kofleriaceae bacterium]|nr:PEGA domain-containing protein [Kofleriaceae bacterium]